MWASARFCFPLCIAASPREPIFRPSLSWRFFGASSRLAARVLTTTATMGASGRGHHHLDFTWDDVLRAAEAEHWPGELPGLQGYAHKVQKCNRGAEFLSEFLPFVIEGQVVGRIHPCIVDHLKKFPDVFSLEQNDDHGRVADSYVTLHSSLRSPKDRTDAMGDTIKCLGESIVPGIRNELYPVTTTFGMPVFFSLERAAAPYFGIKPYGITCKDNLLKECEEEAGIPRNIANVAIAAGAVSYMDIEGYRLKRDVLFCYDLKLPDDFTPSNQDGEVGSFKLIPVLQVANIIRRTEFFKPNCALVIIDFCSAMG